LDVDTRTQTITRCFASAYDTIVVPEPVYLLPNVLTPNGDSRNDVLVFTVPGDDLSLTIFNRFGVQIKTWAKYDNTFTGEGLPPGLYYYLAKNNTNSDVKKSWLEIVK
jgi:gliding motility-associated-like protein